MGAMPLSLDPNILGLCSIAVAAVGVVVSFIVPRLGRARLYFRPAAWSRLGAAADLKGVRIEVIHNQERIDTRVLVYNAQIENTGARDISISEFIGPIELTVPPGYRILSIDLGAPIGVRPSIKVENDRGYLDWQILKPRECIEINAVVCQTTAGATRREAEGLQALIRLRDVSLGPRLRWLSVPKFLWGLMAPLVGLLFIYSAQRDPSYQSYLIYDAPAGTHYAVDPSSGGREDRFGRCVIGPNRTQGSCDKVTHLYVDSIMPKARVNLLHKPPLFAETRIFYAICILFIALFLFEVYQRIIKPLTTSLNNRPWHSVIEEEMKRRTRAQ